MLQEPQDEWQNAQRLCILPLCSLDSLFNSATDCHNGNGNGGKGKNGSESDNGSGGGRSSGGGSSRGCIGVAQAFNKGGPSYLYAALLVETAVPVSQTKHGSSV